MRILGICNDETASACLMVDGKIVCAASEERFTRVKLDNSFPQQAIEFCLHHAGLRLSEVDVVSYAWSKGFDPELLPQYFSFGARYAHDDTALSIAKERMEWEIRRDQKKRQEFDDWIEKNIDRGKQRVVDYYHHEAHAASASLVSPFDSGYVYTSDGRGDFEATTIYRFDRHSDQQLRKLFSSSSSESFGFFYGRITGLLGFKPMRHEGKVTGLAAYGNPEKAAALCAKMMNVKGGKIDVHLGDYYKPFFAPYSDVLQEDVARLSREDVAAAAQRHLETMMVSLLSYYLEADGAKDENLMCAGGVFGNVKVTQRLKQLSGIKRAYVQPQMGDGGLCIGACALANEDFNNGSGAAGRLTKELTSMYLGPVAAYEKKSKSQYMREYDTRDFDFDEAVAQFVEALTNNRVLGLINGRMEFGPRALCNRSIIYKTSDRTINDWLNKRMSRTEFMPFAPVMRAEVADQCIVDFDADDVTLNFMTSTIDCTDDFQVTSPAVVHVDKTARPQIVTKESNAFIWEVLKKWETVSSEKALVNTSFNVHEEPIICNVDEGIASLQRQVIDELWVVSDTGVTCFSVKA